MVFWTIIGTALAGTWTETAQSDGCTFYTGPRSGNYSPVRVICEWDVPAETLHGLIAILDAHDQYFSSVSVAERLPSGRYRQVHQASGISDREVILEMGSALIEGGVRYWWHKADDQSELTGNNVETVVDTGKWEITANGGGSRVVYELLYDPGGSVPSFVVRWFQTSGTQLLLHELLLQAQAQ